MYQITLTIEQLADRNKLTVAAEQARFAILSDPQANPVDLAALAGGDMDVTQAGLIVEHPSCTTDIASATVKRLARCTTWGDTRVLSLIGNPIVSTEAAVALARSTRSGDASVVALSRGDLSADEANNLPKLFEQDTMKALLASGLASEATVESVASDSRSSFRQLVAASACAPESALDLLSHDFTPNVRLAVARNALTSADRLRAMLRDTDASVVTAAMRNLKRRGELTSVETDENEIDVNDPVFGFFFANADDPIVRLDIARNPATDPATLLSMMEHGDQKTADAAASNPSLPVSAMAAIAERVVAVHTDSTSSWSNRREPLNMLYRMSGNPSFPEEWATRLISSDHSYNVGVETAANLLERAGVLSDAAQLSVLGRFQWYLPVMRRLAVSKYLSREVSMGLAKDRRFTLRRLLAGNPACHSDALAYLAADSDNRVADKASKTLDSLRVPA
jgi:hypothetical protein